MRTEDVSYNVKLWVRALMGENALTAGCPLSEGVGMFLQPAGPFLKGFFGCMFGVGALQGSAPRQFLPLIIRSAATRSNGVDYFLFGLSCFPGQVSLSRLPLNSELHHASFPLRIPRAGFPVHVLPCRFSRAGFPVQVSPCRVCP